MVRRSDRLVRISSLSAPPRPGTTMASAGRSSIGPAIQVFNALASGVKPPTPMRSSETAPSARSASVTPPMRTIAGVRIPR